MTPKKWKIARNVSIVLVLLLGCWLGFPFSPRTATTADIEVPQPNANTATVDTTSPPSAFLAGDQRTIPIQRDMLTVLRQIDGRLERIEKLMQQQLQLQQQQQQSR